MNVFSSVTTEGGPVVINPAASRRNKTQDSNPGLSIRLSRVPDSNYLKVRGSYGGSA